MLPSQLLNKAKRIIKNPTLKNLQKAIKIYDIDDSINFQYLDKCGKIDKNNFKFVYTLSFENRKKIIEKYKLKNKILKKKSKILFLEFVNFLINEGDKKSIQNDLNNYQLEHFTTFIIQIHEGTDELKYYYFMSIISDWLRIDKHNGIICLSNFFNFFNDKENIDKIDIIFYIIFRIDLIYFDHDNKIDPKKLLSATYLVDEGIEEKIKGLNLIKDEIKENIDDIEINENTILTLKKNKFKFRPYEHYFPSNFQKMPLIDCINHRTNITYECCLKNKFNYFGSISKTNAFFRYFKMILSSNVMIEYYQKLKSSEEYEFPFSNNNIINFLWKKLIFAEIDEYFGMTNKEGFGIFINRLKGNISNGLGYGLCIISISHEIVTHGLQNLINSNNGIEAGTITPIKSYIRDRDNSITNHLNDSGDKYELFLFGQKVSTITIGGTHFLFNINNWNLSLSKFCKGFRENNIIKNVGILKKELVVLINNDDNVKILFKDVKYDEDTEQSMSARRGNLRFRNKNFVS